MYYVLCLYNDPADQQFITTSLESEGLEVTCVSRIAEAEAAMQQSAYDLFVLDIQPLDGTGLDLISRVRRACSRAGIIILTSIDDETDRVLGLELGADDFLVTPISSRELRARAKAILRRIRPSAGDAYDETSAIPAGDIMFHGLVLRPTARSLHKEESEQQVALTNLEFDVLSALAQHRNRPMTRKEILKEIRGSEWEANDRFVDGVVSRLRRKLYAARDGETHIKTIHGIGYMLAV